jgi:hypothetical protein
MTTLKIEITGEDDFYAVKQISHLFGMMKESWIRRKELSPAGYTVSNIKGSARCEVVQESATTQSGHAPG